MVKSLEDLEEFEPNLDRNKIRKLYPDATGDRNQEWFFDMVKGEETDRLGNHKNANLKNENDGSWSVTGASGLKNGIYGKGKGQVRLEGWSQSGKKKWLNMEITVYAFHVKDIKGPEIDPASEMDYVFQLYGRGGSHKKGKECEAACYKIGVLRTKRDAGKVAVRKEVNHPFYLKERGVQPGTSKNIIGRWIGLKQVLYNFKGNNDRDCVANEIWIDDDSDDNGRLKISNNWRNVSNVNDTGNWGTHGVSDKMMKKFMRNCPRIDMNKNHEHRKPEDIINVSGGSDGGNIGSLRCDSVKLKFKFFSIREIQPPRPDKDAEEAQ